MDQAYVLEFGDHYIRFYKSKGLIVSAGAAYEIASPYAVADLQALAYAQTADTMYLAHPSHPMQKLTRSAHTSWTIGPVAFVDGPYLDPNPATENGVNLVTDGDCERDSGWASVGTPTTQARSTDGAYSGSYCRKFVIDAAGEGCRWGNFTTVTGNIYRMTFAVYAGTGNVRFAVRSGANSGYAVDVTKSSVPYNKWTEYAICWQETAGGSGAYVEFTAGSGATGTWYIDMVDVHNLTTILLKPSAASGTGITLTATSPVFEAGHVGAFFRILNNDGDWGYVKVTAVASGTSATADVVGELGGTDATENWLEGAWSAKRGFPGVIGFNEQRLVAGFTKADPQMLWASKDGADYLNMTSGTTDADPYRYKIASGQVNVIRWLSTLGVLLVGTSGGNFRMSAPDNQSPITPNAVRCTPQTRYGSANIQPINLGASLLFVERQGDPKNLGVRVRSLAYNLQTDGYVGTDLTLLADHITGYDASNYYYLALNIQGKYPHGVTCIQAAGSGAWAGNPGFILCFMVVPTAAGQFLQTGGLFDAKLKFNQGTPIDQSDYLTRPLRDFMDGTGFTYEGVWEALTKDKTFADFAYGLNHDRIVLRCNAATGYPSVSLYDSAGGLHTVAGTTDASAGKHQIGFKVRMKNDGADFLFLYVDGVSQGTPITGHSFPMDPNFRELGTATIGGGFGLTTRSEPSSSISWD